jgi:hypothetical protein
MSCHRLRLEAGKASTLGSSENVDCLVCPRINLYQGDYVTCRRRGSAGGCSFGAITTTNCGSCHFDRRRQWCQAATWMKACISHGKPDVLGGDLDFQCTDCHLTKDHQILGRLLADNYTIQSTEQVSCTQCHVDQKHSDERLNAHLDAVACQTCHIPAVALEDPTKVVWDWSKAGQSGRADDHFTYLKIKGEFLYEKNYKPEYLWFNGSNGYRYLLGDKINSDGITYINKPAGNIQDPNAKIFPFKLHKAIQPYDRINDYLLQPITSGKDGFWTDFNWDTAFGLASPFTGLNYSGEYAFTETYMYWPTTHMVQPVAHTPQCTDCHSNWPPGLVSARIPGDPMEWGGR